MIRRKLCLATFALLLPFAAQANMELPQVFGDGAVIQRNQPIRLWGWSAPHARVQVQFDHSRAEAIADAQGRWQVQLPAHEAGGPFELSARSGDEAVVSHDLLVGDVYLASGQSNMEFQLYRARNADAEIAHATDGMIREIKVPDAWGTQPADHLPGAHWVAASPDTARDFSAVAYFFAREIRANQHVPIGIINDNWGGSRIEPWMDAATAGVQPSAIEARIAREDAAQVAILATTRKHLQRWQDALDATPADPDKARFAAPDLDEHAWTRIAVPAFWETRGYDGMDGVAWYRTHFTVSATEAAQGLTLDLGMIDDSDFTWVNGRLVGQTDNAWNHLRAYHVPAAALHAGRNTLAIRVDDLGAGGGLHGDPGQLAIHPKSGAPRPFNGPWLFRPEAVRLVATDAKNQIPTLLYNRMIHPLLPLALRGVLWYQGEANTADADAFVYRDQFKALIEQWRHDFQQPDLPFLWVQLANFKMGTDTATTSGWAMLRESQSAALALPHTAQAVTIDVGDPDTIHPTNKQAVGHRLALAARHVVYGQSLVYRGPVYRAMTVDGDAIRLRFETAGSALEARDAAMLDGFTIAGTDHRFHPAHARIEGDSVVVNADAVPHPLAVRYGWSENPVEANLINAAGLPASPFRTDTW